MPHDHLALGQIFESCVDIVGKSLSSSSHCVDVHAVATRSHNATKATSTKLQVLVERLDELGLVVGLNHGLDLSFGFLVITLAKPLLSFNRQLLNQFLVIHSFNVLFIVIIIFPQR